MILPESCPVHCGELLSVEDKPQLLGKCVWLACTYGILADDPYRQVQDISEFNYTTSGQPSETL
jgi:hypothetical protein